MIGNYYELTIKQFLRCKTIADLESDPLQRKINMLAEVSGKTVDEIESLPISELNTQLAKFSSIEALTPTDKVKMKFKVGGKRFECIWRTQEMTSYQYIDATSFCNDPVNNIHNILAAITVERDILGRRKKYDGTKHKERAELFYNEMKIKDAYPIMLFFCNYLEALSHNTQIFLTEEVMRLKAMAEKFLQKDGVGLSTSTR